MASPPLAELAPRESELASAKPGWAEDRSSGSPLLLLDLRCQSVAQFLGVGQSPRHTHPGSAGCRGPTHSHLCIPTKGPEMTSSHPQFPSNDQAKIRA